MDLDEIEKLNKQSKGFQVISAVIGIVFGAAAIEISLRLTSEYEGVTFGALLLAAPLFTVGLLGMLCFWFARMIAANNQLLAELLKDSRQHRFASDSNGGSATSQTAMTQRPSVLKRMEGPPGVAPDSNGGSATSQTALTQRPSVLKRMEGVSDDAPDSTSEPGAPERICAVTDCGRNSHSGHALCRSHLGLD